MRSTINITVKIDPGSLIDDAFKDAVSLANKLKCTIVFNFNEVTCMANPGTDPEIGVSAYHEAISSKRTYKFAVTQ